MFCANCGKEVLDGMKFCPTCGVSTSWESYESENFRSETPSSAVWVKKDFETIRSINEKSKKSSKIKEAFEDFFRDCRWEYFESTEGENIVEFYGTCTYGGGDGNVRMQFIIEDDGSGKLHTISVNEEIQPELVQGLFLLKIFESYGSDASDKVFDVEDEVESDKEEVVEESKKADDTEVAERRQEAVENMLQTTDLRFPILFQGYIASQYCPVMINDETDNGLSMGTYEQMLASCVDDGDTRYAPPVLQNGEIYLPTRWDVPDSDWYMGLLTYDEFLQVIEQIVIAYEEDGISEFYTSLDWKKAGVLSGKWSDGATNLSISIYSDFSTAGIGIEIGNWNISGTSIEGTVRALGDYGDIIRVLCVTEDGAEMELVCSGNSLRVQNVIGDIGIENGTQLTCIERYQP